MSIRDVVSLSRNGRTRLVTNGWSSHVILATVRGCQIIFIKPCSPPLPPVPCFSHTDALFDPKPVQLCLRGGPDIYSFLDGSKQVLAGWMLIPGYGRRARQ